MPPQAGNRSLPDFIVIGAQKSATTSLLAYLGQHPQVRLGAKKATHYFDLHHGRSLEWYARHFPPISRLPFIGRSTGGAPRAWLTGESCPSYMFLPEVPARVKAALPQVKLIAILRQPVSRLISQYYHEKRKQRAAPSFAAFIAPSMGMDWPPPPGDIENLRRNAAVPRGYYAAQLAHWRAYFPKHQLHVECFEDLVREPARTVNRVFAFLGLPPCEIDASEALNSGGGREREGIDPALIAELGRIYARANAGLEDIAGRSFEW